MHDYTDHFVMLFTPHGRMGGAGRRVADERQNDPELSNELYRPVFPCSIRGGCGHRDNSGSFDQNVIRDET